jgi:phosphoenolpyruvate phosphomutase
MTVGSTKAGRLRASMADGRLVRAVGAHDGLSARMVEQAGFDAVWVSSFELSASYALPDASLLDLTRYLDEARSIEAVTAIPVIADCDTGFGGPLNVAHAVRAYEASGIAAICIEDKVFPKMNSFADVRHDLLPAEEFERKIKAGKRAQAGDDFALIARTEALVSGCGADEALSRMQRYAHAGADAILVHSRCVSPDPVLRLAERWTLDVPLVAVPTTYSSVRERTLADVGFRIVIYANHGLRAAVRNMRTVLARLAMADHAAAVEDMIAPMADIFALQDMPATYRVQS